MTEKTEWEVVDDPAAGARRSYYAGYADQARQADEAGYVPGGDPRRAAQAATAAMLGPWWKWKLAGVASLALVVFAFFATVVGVAALSLVALAIVAAGARKVKLWLRGDRNTSIMKR